MPGQKQAEEAATTRVPEVGGAGHGDSQAKSSLGVDGASSLDDGL